MTTYDACEIEARPMPALTGPLRLFVPVLQLWRAIEARMEERRAIHHLYQLDEHMLRDLGFDPGAIYAAREGAIGEWKSQRCGKA